MMAGMLKRSLRRAAVLVLLWMGVFSISTFTQWGFPPEAEAAESVTVSMSWLFSGRHSWYFAAMDNGYFKKENLTVKIIRGYGGGDTVKKLSTGAFQAAEIDAGNTIIARSRGAKVKMISVHLIKAPFGIFSLKPAGIKKPQDLHGKTIGAGKIDAMRVLFPAFAKKAGIDASKVTWMSMIPSGKVGALKRKKVHAITGYVDSFGGALMVKGFNFQILRFANYGFDVLSNGIVTTDKVIADRSAMLKSLTGAVNRAIVWTMANQKEAVRIMSKHHPESNAKIFSKQLEITAEFMGDINRPHFGRIDRDRMKVTRDLLVKAMNLKPVALDDIYTNRFVD